MEARVVAATEQLLSDGERFTNLGVRRIADAAGIARSTFYVHFADKSELLMRLSDNATAGIFDVANDWCRNRHEQGVEGLEEALFTMITEFREHAPALRAVAEVAAYDDEIQAYWQRGLEGFSRELVDALESDKSAGLTAPDVDLEAAAWFISLGAERVVTQQANVGSPADDRRMAQGAARVMWRAIYG